MDVIEAINRRRSIRQFKCDPISEDVIRTILAAGIKAPSGRNRQPWEFVVVTGGKRLEMVWVMREGIQTHRAENKDERIKSVERTVNIMEQAPVTIFIFNPYGKQPWQEKTTEEQLAETIDVQSVGAAIQNMILAAKSLGIGSLWICNVFFAYKELCQWLNKDSQMVAALAIGYPDENPPMRPRKAIDEVTAWL
ncbi:MAG TPA: nitroreductase family protein [Firmicutes bacterium]|nr:nitroreductase family protein [Bacillota bacterium]